MTKQNIDIFLLGRILEEKFPDLLQEVDDAPLSIALADFCEYAEKISQELIPKIATITPGDYESLENYLMELQEVIEHNLYHLNEANNTLRQLLSKINV